MASQQCEQHVIVQRLHLAVRALKVLLQERLPLVGATRSDFVTAEDHLFVGSGEAERLWTVQMVHVVDGEVALRCDKLALHRRPKVSCAGSSVLKALRLFGILQVCCEAPAVLPIPVPLFVIYPALHVKVAQLLLRPFRLLRLKLLPLPLLPRHQRRWRLRRRGRGSHVEWSEALCQRHLLLLRQPHCFLPFLYLLPHSLLL
mmetsp:Transcript_15545/g.27546  ORF Transcript_15545/g.27546 Transcript_15545/m.27546 type:complete len:202 (-) Transcript_15545:370-975(-)